jgi:hypothetical protein
MKIRIIVYLVTAIVASVLIHGFATLAEEDIRQSIRDDARRAHMESRQRLFEAKERIKKARAWNVACDDRGNFAIYNGSGSLIELPFYLNSEKGANEAITYLRGEEDKRRASKGRDDFAVRQRELEARFNLCK